MSNGSTEQMKMTAGMDLGDNYSHLCLIDTESGQLIEESRLRTTPEAMRRRFDSEQRPLHVGKLQSVLLVQLLSATAEPPAQVGHSDTCAANGS